MMRSRPLRALVAALAAATTIAATGVATSRWLSAPVDDGVITLLLLGSDQGPPRGGPPDQARADAFHLLFVSPDRQHATFVNLPRDAYVPVPGRGRTKINSCLVAGPSRCVETVESVFGVDVDHHLLTSMHGLADAFEQFGGLDVDVERALSNGGPDIAAGQQHLNGYEVLTYTRDRKNRPDGDFGRSHAQSEVLARAHADLVSDPDLGSVARAVAILARHTITDASPADLLRYGYAALELPPGNVDNVNAPGDVGFAGEASVVRLRDEAYALIRDAADDGRVTDA
jgi:LCP family protein required for cell wall assembly